MRIVAPFPSAISAPEISDTSTVLRATYSSLENVNSARLPYRKRAA